MTALLASSVTLAVTILLLAVSSAIAARELGLIGNIIGSISLPALPLLPRVGYTLGSVGLDVQILSGSATIELLPPPVGKFKPQTNTNRTGPFLYVWNAYGKSYTDPLLALGSTDFLATIDLNINSPTFKKIVHIENLENTGNEPHHISVSYDRTRLLGGGLLSFLKVQDDHFLFDIEADPATPKLLKSSQLPLTAVTDHAFGLKSGGFLTTQMGSKIGGTPGGITVYDKNLNSVRSYPDVPPSGFNPHGADVNSALDLVLTTDFINPLSTVTGQVFGLVPNLVPGLTLDDIVPLADIVKRSTVRVWKLSDLSTIQKTIELPGGQGIIDIKIIPGVNPKGLAFATGVFDGGVFLVNPAEGSATRVLDFGTAAEPHLLASAAPDGSRFFLTLAKAGILVYLNTADPYNPEILDSIQLGANAAPHYIQPLGPGDNRVAVADYFLDQGAIGKVHNGGNKKVFIIPFNSTNLGGGGAYAFDFKPLNGRPHGIATNLQYTDVEL